MKPFKPMLADPPDFKNLRFPLLGSPKIDGVRSMAMGGRPMSRAMKVLPSLHLQQTFNTAADIIDGLDGELVVGSATDERVLGNTTSHVMAHDKVYDFTYFAFDLWGRGDGPYHDAYEALLAMQDRLPPWVQVLKQTPLNNMGELEAFEAAQLELGFEGIMLRDPAGRYKQGRSTARDGILNKVKRWSDCEALVTGFEELMHNGNEAFQSELGRTKRSTAQGGMVGLDSLGAFVCRGLAGTPFEGVEFTIGGGRNGSLTHADRKDFWNRRGEILGKMVKFAYFPVGIKDKPRHPKFLAFRDVIDMDPPSVGGAMAYILNPLDTLEQRS